MLCDSKDSSKSSHADLPSLGRQKNELNPLSLSLPINSNDPLSHSGDLSVSGDSLLGDLSGHHNPLNRNPLKRSGVDTQESNAPPRRSGSQIEELPPAAPSFGDQPPLNSLQSTALKSSPLASPDDTMTSHHPAAKQQQLNEVRSSGTKSATSDTPPTLDSPEYKIKSSTLFLNDPAPTFDTKTSSATQRSGAMAALPPSLMQGE